VLPEEGKTVAELMSSASAMDAFKRKQIMLRQIKINFYEENDILAKIKISTINIFFYCMYFCLGSKKTQFLKEKKNYSSPVHHPSVKGKFGSIKMYKGRYCEYCFDEFTGKRATTYLIRNFQTGTRMHISLIQKGKN
jgi:hypothetical protein